MDAVRVRRMRKDDLPSAERASAATFLEAERVTRRVSDPEPEPRSAEASRQWIERRGFLIGTVDRSTLPAVNGLREGGADDIGWMDQLERRPRGAGHGPDHEYLLGIQRLVVSRDSDRPGYVYIDIHGHATPLAAARPDTAQNLLWEALATSRGTTLVNRITSPNEWAVDLGLAARLDIGQEGYIAVRDMPVPAPYLASGHFL